MTRNQRIVISLILRADAGILLMRRAKPYSEFLRYDPDTEVGIGLWELPGGGIDFGETPLESGVRETFEETGIAIDQKNLELAGCCAYILKSSTHESHRIHVIYKASLSVAPEVKHSDEHLAYTWVKGSSVTQDLSMIPEIRNVLATDF